MMMVDVDDDDDDDDYDDDDFTKKGKRKLSRKNESLFNNYINIKIPKFSTKSSLPQG